MTRMRRGRRLVLAVLLVGALAACGTSAPAPRRPTGAAPRPGAGVHVAARVGGAVQLVADTRAQLAASAPVGTVARAEQAFTVSLLQQLAGGAGNVTVSPASLTIALSMLENGTAGATRQQIADALGVGAVPLAGQNAAWRALTGQWSSAAAAGSFQLRSANSLWTQRGFRIEPAYLAALRAGYGAGIWQVDFADRMSEALHAIDAWCAQQTAGRIAKLFDNLDPSTVAVLANAVYFKADWQLPFDSKATTRAPFTTADGTTVRVPTMHSTDLSAPAAVTPDYEAVQLPYKGARFAAVAIMPTAQSLADFVGGLTPTGLERIMASLHGAPVDLAMPSFTTTSTIDLVDTLRRLGITDAFDGGDFTPMTPKPVMVSDVLQRDYLSVTEKGTEAAAVTGIAIATSGVAAQPVVIHLDHPFLFLVRDTTTGAVLFASAVNDPSAG